MKIKNFEFYRDPTGGLEILVKQTSAENAPVISELRIPEDHLYELLAHLDLSADEELDDSELDLAEDEDQNDEEE